MNGSSFGALVRDASYVSQMVEHVLLVGAAMALALLLALPLGVISAGRPRMQRVAMSLANLAQTIPSLALFGFLMPLDVSVAGVRLVGGLGTGTAVTALVLYAILPILRNTVEGLRGVDPLLREAAMAMGMTPRQRFWRVELPLALPTVLAGIRVATVLTVATATVAAAIDAGGLGKSIFRGLRLGDQDLILAGAGGVAVLALLLDGLLGAVQALVTRRLARPSSGGGGRRPWVWFVGLIVLGAGVWAAGRPIQTPLITVGAKDFTEQLLLGELLAQELEARGARVRRRFELGGSLAHQALVAGDIDVYPEYTGTAWQGILRRQDRPAAPAMRVSLQEAYKSKWSLAWSEPLGFDNTFAILVRSETAKRHGVTTISEVSPLVPSWRLGFGQDFMGRSDGWGVLSGTYGFRPARAPREMELALTYRALADGQLDLVAGNATDGIIRRMGFVQLLDDRKGFPPYEAAYVHRSAALARHPQLAPSLAVLAGRIDGTTMRRLNDAVDHERLAPEIVVRSWRQSVSADRP